MCRHPSPSGTIGSISQPWHARANLPLALALAAFLLAAVASLAGLLAPDLYRDTESWTREARATDVVTLLFAVPVLAIGRMGDPPALGEIVSRLPRCASGIFLIAVAVLIGLLWASEIAAAVTADGPTETLAHAGLPTNPIWALDLAFALPVVAYGGVRLLRADAWAAATALQALVFLVLIGLAVLGVFAYSAVAGEEVVLVPVILVAIITLIAVSLTFVALRDRPVTTPEQGA